MMQWTLSQGALGRQGNFEEIVSSVLVDGIEYTHDDEER